MDNKGRRTNNELEMIYTKELDHKGMERRVVRVRRKVHRERPEDRLDNFVYKYTTNHIK